MIIIPEIETVLILVPRTGTGSLRRAVAAAWPKSFLLYRHMEADGTPHGYDRWPRVGVVRDPVDRLWSLYKFMRAGGGGGHGPAFVARMRRSAEMPFDRWLRENEMVFVDPHDSGRGTMFWPGLTVRHALPENRKSQFVYLRPDLGTTVWRYEDLDRLAATLGVTLDRGHNATEPSSPPSLSAESRRHVEMVFGWDIDVRRILDHRTTAPEAA